MCVVQIPEVLLWAKEQNEEKSPNLTQFTEHFNNMSYWQVQKKKKHHENFTSECFRSLVSYLPFPSLPCRVRSLIIQQEKAQDREKLLLKFIKIMKVCKKLGPAHVLLTRHVTGKPNILFLFIAALKEVEQFQLLPGNTVRPGLGPHQEVRVAETDFRGKTRAGGG